jgi:hypothetical protein
VEGCSAGLSSSRCPVCFLHCRQVLGIINKPGCFAEYITLPAANLHRVPEELSDAEAAFCEPLAAACRVLEQGLLDSSQDSTQTVAVVGECQNWGHAQQELPACLLVRPSAHKITGPLPLHTCQAQRLPICLSVHWSTTCLLSAAAPSCCSLLQATAVLACCSPKCVR